ncbi:MAG: amidohydrolase family protein [Gemmatimonadota bacterium]
MKVTLSFALVASLLTVQCRSIETVPDAGPPALGSGQVAFVNVNVIPMDRERVLADQTVVVTNGRITAVGPAARTTVPPNAIRVDGRGKYLTPGLAEMHGHVPAANPNAVLTPENVLFMYIAGGATTVRGMQGHPSHLPLRQRVESGELIGPRLYLSSPPLSGNNATDAATAEQLVRNAKQAGYDHLKVHENLSKTAYDAIVKTAREVGLEWGGHVSVHVGVRGAIAARQSTIDHLDDYVEGLEGDESKIAELAKLTRDAGVAVVPTMPLWEVLRGLHAPASMNDRAELRYMPPQTRQNWANTVGQTHANADRAAAQKEITLRNRILKALSDAGALVLLGSDAPQLYSVPGFSLQREMETMVEAGMTPFQVLQSGTINVAKFHKNESETGTVAVGRRADLLLLDANPLQDIRNMNRKAGVMVKGRWLPWPEIQQRLDQIAAAYR